MERGCNDRGSKANKNGSNHGKGGKVVQLDRKAIVEKIQGKNEDEYSSEMFVHSE